MRSKTKTGQRVRARPIIRNLLSSLRLSYTRRLRVGLNRPFRPRRVRRQIFIFRLARYNSSLVRNRVVRLKANQQTVIHHNLTDNIILLVTTNSQLNNVVLNVILVRTIVTNTATFNHSQNTNHVKFHSNKRRHMNRRKLRQQ